MLLELLTKIIKFFSKKYWIFLILVVLISYGQMLWMQPWEDDNALFFKLAHIQEPAGYFGAGPLGSGIYKYAVVPFIPIYKLFGFNTVAYFALLIILYAITTLVVYKFFSYLLGEKGGKVAGFLYASGFITSDGFWRMANSATTSITIILISVFVKFYWKYYKEKRNRYYFLALTLFFLAVHYSVVRNHYLIAIAVFFELIFLAFQKSFKSIILSIFRLVPFIYIFYRWVILVGDSRTGGVRDFVLSILSGQLSQTYGFISSFSNLIIPDYFTNTIYNLFNRTAEFFVTPPSFVRTMLFIFSAIVILFILKGEKKRKLLIPVFYLFLLFWFLLSNKIYMIPIINPTDRQLFTVALGGILVIVSMGIYVVLKKDRKIFLFLILWLITNALAYSTYYPLVVYDTINRYLAHSFFIYVGILGLLYTYINKQKRLGKLLATTILLFGVVNIYHSVMYQNNILINRSYPVKIFYKDLSYLLPKISKGDVLYFDISNNAQRYFRDAISTAMMPDTTSFAWRYGVDRYDFDLVINVDNLTDLVSTNQIALEKIHFYWYSKNALIDTTEDTRNYFYKSDNIFRSTGNLPVISKTNINLRSFGSTWQQPEITIDIDSPIKSISPVEAVVTIIACPLEARNLQFPLYSGIVPEQSSVFSIEETMLVLQYKELINDFYRNSVFKVSSNWQDRTLKNLSDNNPDTMWQSDRVLWQNKSEFIEVKLPTLQEIDRVYWLSSSYKYSFPTTYEISSSVDGVSWQNVNIINIINNEVNHVVKFTPVSARYVKMHIKETLGDDSPMIAEFRVIPSKFSKLELVKAENFLINAFRFIPDVNSYDQILSGLNYKGKLNIYWFGNKEENWQTTKETELEIIYDGEPHQYRFILPAGGTLINKIKFSDITIPGKLILNSFAYHQYYK